MTKIPDSEYLARPLIEDVVFTIENDYVKIACPHTLFTESRRIEFIQRDEILSLYKSVLRKAKAKGVKIAYSQHIRRTVDERWLEYEVSCKRAGELFDLIIEQSKVIQSRGIHRGTTDDAELDKLAKFRNEHGEFSWRSSITSKITGIYHELRELERELVRTDNSLYQIYL